MVPSHLNELATVPDSNGIHSTVIGPGAIGLLVAAHLHRGEASVNVLDYRQDRARELEQKGITISTHNSRYKVCLQISTHPAILRHADLVWVCVKAHATRNLCQQIKPFLRPQTCLISLQNGLTHINDLQDAFPGHPMLVGSITTAARLTTPTHVRQVHQGTIRIAALSGNSREAAHRVVTFLQNVGWDAGFEPDAQRMLWSKAILNSAINPLTALYHITNGELPQHPEAGPMAHAIIREGICVAKAIGISFAPDAMLERFAALCHDTAENHSSMRCDLEKGRRTEWDAINGEIIRRARDFNIPTPINQHVTLALQA